MSFPLSDAQKGNWIFTVDFDLSRVARFDAGDLALLNTEAELVKAFYMTARDGGPGAIGAIVDMKRIPMDETN